MASDDEGVREFDGLLVQAKWNRSSTWYKASNHCKASRIGGHADWRLPSKTELQALQQAGLLEKGSYWSATRADNEGKMSFVVRSDRARARTWERTDEGGSSLCVRRK